MLSTSRTRSLVLVVACLAVAACGPTPAPGLSASSSTPSTGASATSPTATTTTSATPSTQSATPVDRDPLTHKLLAEDFSQGPGVFHVGDLNGYTYAVKDGAYVITATSKPSGPAETYGEYARVAYAIDSSVDVVGAASAGTKTAVGIACFDAAGENGLMMLAAADGSGGAYLRFVNGVPDAEPLAEWGASLTSGAAVTSLRFLAAISNPLNDDVRLSGWVNGVAVPASPETDKFEGCAGMVLLLMAPTKGVSVSFDNARAIVPGE
ncbi:hypothetical protein [Longivirga aurantiaca]|uniref:Lipoprotein n=1 Tax=Longivirga aurantiaca TaxID=1837743 RepID=A0ABW1T028_9ACTN